MKVQNFDKLLKRLKKNAKPIPSIKDLYELDEFTNEIPTIIDIIRKIKNELEITHCPEEWSYE